MPAKKTTNKKVAKKAVKKAVKKAAAKKAVKKAAAKTVTKKVAKKVAKKAVVKKASPSKEALAKAAYEIYRRRVDLGLPGDQASDWLEAERLLSNG